MSDPAIIAATADAVGTITVNRPRALNALDMATLAALEAAFAQMERDPAVRVVIVTGAGDKAFVAGGDVADLRTRRGLAHYQEYAERIHRVLAAFERSDKPTIAAVNGWALGGGVELLLSLDLRIAAATARLGVPEINLGLFPGAGGSQRLIRQVPLARARELMFLGEPIGADEALRIGLINRVVPPAELMAAAHDWARKLAAKSPLVLKLLKRTLRAGAEMPLGAALSHEQAMIGLVLDSDDAHEGCAAFLEKRDARFTGT